MEYQRRVEETTHAAAAGGGLLLWWHLFTDVIQGESSNFRFAFKLLRLLLFRVSAQFREFQTSAFTARRRVSTVMSAVSQSSSDNKELMLPWRSNMVKKSCISTHKRSMSARVTVPRTSCDVVTSHVELGCRPTSCRWVSWRSTGNITRRASEDGSLLPQQP